MLSRLRKWPITAADRRPFRCPRFAAAIFVLYVPFGVAATVCDTSLVQPATNPLGYRLRGDRCEGVYVQQVSGAPLTVVSWTQSFADYDLSSKRSLRITWQMAHGAPIRLRAQGLRRRLYYRMDAAGDPNSKSFNWPADVLSGLQIPRHDVGIVGTTEVDVEGSRRQVYVPLRVGQDTSSSLGDSYSLTLLPGTELKELFVTLTGPSGKMARKLKDGGPVGYGYYPAERPVEIPIAGMKVSGFYHLEIGATLRSGGAAATDFWFYHPGS
jgi:hypothetical protein